MEPPAELRHCRGAALDFGDNSGTGVGHGARQRQLGRGDVDEGPKSDPLDHAVNLEPAPNPKLTAAAQQVQTFARLAGIAPVDDFNFRAFVNQDRSPT